MWSFYYLKLNILHKIPMTNRGLVRSWFFHTKYIRPIIQDRGERSMATLQFRQPLCRHKNTSYSFGAAALKRQILTFYSVLLVFLLHIVLKIIPDKCILLGCTSTYKNAVKTNIINMYEYYYLDLIFENILVNTLEQDSNDNINYYNHIST